MVPNAFKDQTNEKTKNTNIIDLFIFLLKYKWMILLFIFLAGIATPLYLYKYAVSLPKIYFAQCTISPSDSSRTETDSSRTETDRSRTDKIKIILQSRDLNMMVAKENHLSIIWHNIWDERTNKWVSERRYVWDEQGGRLLTVQPGSIVAIEGEPTLYISDKNHILNIGFSSNERDKAINILDRYLSYISDFYRKRDMEILKIQRNVYEEQLITAKDTYQKVQLAEKIIDVTDKELRAKNDRYYGYNMMDPLYVIEVKPQEQITKGSITKEMPKTKRHIMMTILFMMAAFVIALSIAGVMEYLTFIKKNDPEKFAVLLKHLGFKKRIGRSVDPD